MNISAGADPACGTQEEAGISFGKWDLLALVVSLGAGKSANT